MVGCVECGKETDEMFCESCQAKYEGYMAQVEQFYYKEAER